jgi:hypothetical protein
MTHIMSIADSDCSVRQCMNTTWCTSTPDSGGEGEPPWVDCPFVNLGAATGAAGSLCTETAAGAAAGCVGSSFKALAGATAGSLTAGPSDDTGGAGTGMTGGRDGGGGVTPADVESLLSDQVSAVLSKSNSAKCVCDGCKHSQSIEENNTWVAMAPLTCACSSQRRFVLAEGKHTCALRDKQEHALNVAQVRWCATRHLELLQEAVLVAQVIDQVPGPGGCIAERILRANVCAIYCRGCHHLGDINVACL